MHLTETPATDHQVPANSADSGFTLIEVLVAFAVLSVGLAGVYGAMTNEARVEADISLRREAMRAAQSHLDRLLVERTPAGETTGRYANGIIWRVTVTSLGRVGGAPEITSEPARLLLVASDARGRPLVTFDTVSLIGRAPVRIAP